MPPKELTHTDLMNLVRVFAPKITKEGVCEGTTKMWIQTILTNVAARRVFYNRLTDILPPYFCEAKKNLKNLKKEIKALLKSQKNLINRRPFTESELDKIEIRAVCEGIAAHQDIHAIQIAKDIPQGHPIHYALSASKLLEEEGILIQSNGVGVIAPTAKELALYFQEVEKLLLKYPNEKTAFSLCCENHTTGIYFNIEYKEWRFFNVNMTDKLSPFTIRFVTDRERCMDPETCKILPISDLPKDYPPEKDTIYIEKTEKNVQFIILDPNEGARHPPVPITIPLENHIHSFAPLRNFIPSILNVTSQLGGPYPTLETSLKSFIFPSFYDNKHPHTLFEITCHFTYPNPEMITALQALADGFAPTHCLRTNSRGLNALYLAALNGQLHSVNALINAKANINIIHPLDGTPLMMATQRGYLDIVKALITAGANLNISCKGMTALALAKKFKKTEIIKLLVDAGAPENFKSQLYQYRMKHLPLTQAQEQLYAVEVVNMLTALKNIQANPFKIERKKAIPLLLYTLQEKHKQSPIGFKAQHLIEIICYGINQVFSNELQTLKKEFPFFKKNSTVLLSHHQRRAIYDEQNKRLWSATDTKSPVPYPRR